MRVCPSTWSLETLEASNDLIHWQGIATNVMAAVVLTRPGQDSIGCWNSLDYAQAGTAMSVMSSMPGGALRIRGAAFTREATVAESPATPPST